LFLDESALTTTYLLSEPPSRIQGKAHHITQTVSIPIGNFNDWTRHLLAESRVTFSIIPASSRPFLFCVLRGQSGFDQYQSSGDCNIGSFMVNSSGFNYSLVIPSDEVYHFIIENQFEPEWVKTKTISISLTLEPIIYDITYAQDFLIGSFIKDIPYGESIYFAVYNPSKPTKIQTIFAPRTLFIWFLFLIMDGILLCVTSFISHYLILTWVQPSEEDQQPISKGLQLLIKSNQQDKREYASISFNSHLAIQHQITKQKAGVTP